MKKVAIVTAASKGMGLAIAEQFAEQNYELMIMSRGEEILSVAERLGAKYIQGSTDNQDDISRLISRAREEYGRVDILVNNTGHAAKGDLLSICDNEWHDGLDLLLMNVIRSAKLITPIFQKQGGGIIVNISTFGAIEPSLNFPISSVMRAALGSYTKLYVERYAKENIRMNNVLPGFIDSYPATEEIINSIPAKRQGTTKEIADVVSFLCDDASKYINGQSILVDGGLTKSI